MKNNLRVILFTFTILILAPLPIAYSDHGAGGGGCSGDCTPPTLGEDNSGRIFVNDGFKINNFSVDVAAFQQDVKTQTIVVGQPVEITIQVYENEGPGRFSHAGLMLGLETKTINGIRVDSHPVQINWDKTFEQKTTFEVIDNGNLVGNVNVVYELKEDAFGYEDNVTEITFSFTPLQTFDTNSILVEVWDYNRNSWVNIFNNALLIVNNDASSIGEIKIYNPEDSILKVPSWIKLNAKLWAQSQIDDATFVQGIKYCIDNRIMNIPNLPDYEPEGVLPFVDLKKGQQYYLDRYYNEPIYKEWFDENFPDYTIEEAVGLNDSVGIPSWIKSNADLWANDVITDSDFVSGIEYLVKNGIIIV